MQHPSGTEESLCWGSHLTSCPQRFRTAGVKGNLAEAQSSSLSSYCAPSLQDILISTFCGLRLYLPSVRSGSGPTKGLLEKNRGGGAGNIHISKILFIPCSSTLPSHACEEQTQVSTGGKCRQEPSDKFLKTDNFQSFSINASSKGWILKAGCM